MSETTTTRKPKTKVDSNETPEQRFIRLTNARGDKLVHQMKLLKNLATSYAYKVNPELAESKLLEFKDKLEALEITWTEAIEKIRGKPEPSDVEDGVETETVDNEETVSIE